MVEYDDGVMRMQRVREKCRVFEMVEWTSRKMISSVGPAHQTAVKPARRDELVLENRRVAHFEIYPLRNKEVEIALRE
jgi:hypothetical protein